MNRAYQILSLLMIFGLLTRLYVVEFRVMEYRAVWEQSRTEIEEIYRTIGKGIDKNYICRLK